VASRSLRRSGVREWFHLVLSRLVGIGSVDEASRDAKLWEGSLTILGSQCLSLSTYRGMFWRSCV
jgi:hypothetical protein